MILTRMGVIAASSAVTASITYYTIALSGSYQEQDRPNDIDLYWDSGSGYNYVTTLTNPPWNKTECHLITTFSIASGSAIGSIKFSDPGNCYVRFGFVYDDPVCANVADPTEFCEYDLGIADANRTHAIQIKVNPGSIGIPPIPPSFDCC